MAKAVKLADITLEDRSKFLDAILIPADDENQLSAIIKTYSLDADKTSVTYTKIFPPKIDKTSAHYKNGLVEGVAPEPSSMEVGQYKTAVQQYGEYIPFTDKEWKHDAYELVKSYAVPYLRNKFGLLVKEKAFDAALSSANVITDCDLTQFDDLSRIKDILFNNGCDPIDGVNYLLFVPTEVASKMLGVYKDIVDHTTQKEAIIKGEIGEINGFRIIRCNTQALKDVGDGKYRFLAVGRSQVGNPLGKVAYGQDNGEIILKDLGENGQDPLNQNGSVGIKIDGVGWFVVDDSCIISGVSTLEGLKYTTEFNHANGSNIIHDVTTPTGITADVTNLTLAVGETYTFRVIKDADSSDISSTAKYFVSDTNLAAMDGTTTNKITAKKSGVVWVTITSDNSATTVQVIITNAKPTKA